MLLYFMLNIVVCHDGEIRVQKLQPFNGGNARAAANTNLPDAVTWEIITPQPKGSWVLLALREC